MQINGTVTGDLKPGKDGFLFTGKYKGLQIEARGPFELGDWGIRIPKDEPPISGGQHAAISRELNRAVNELNKLNAWNQAVKKEG